MVVSAPESVNVAGTLASATLSRKVSQRVINPELYRQRPPPWGQQEMKAWARTCVTSFVVGFFWGGGGGGGGGNGGLETGTPHGHLWLRHLTHIWWDTHPFRKCISEHIGVNNITLN